MKKILFIYERRLSELPPLLTLIEILKLKGYDVTVIVSKIDNNYKDIRQISYIQKDHNRWWRLLNRKILSPYYFKYKIPQLIKKENFDRGWIIVSHYPKNIFYLNNFLNQKNIKFNSTIYELYDTFPEILNKLSKLVRSSENVIVPELNRAYLLKNYLKLKDLPMVMPNKPNFLPAPTSEFDNLFKDMGDKKIILYQGHITKMRPLAPICEAIKDNDEYVLLLMGSCNDGYLEELQKNYLFVKHINFITPPNHLQITTKAYLGIVSYGKDYLNGVYCAPNKIWEYAGYGVPMLCSDNLGLKYTVEHSKSGVCVDFNNIQEIREAISLINTNYEAYSQKALQMFDSINLSALVDDILL